MARSLASIRLSRASQAMDALPRLPFLPMIPYCEFGVKIFHEFLLINVGGAS